MTEQKRIPVMVNTADYEKLRKLAYETHISMSEHIRRAISEYLKAAE